MLLHALFFDVVWHLLQVHREFRKPLIVVAPKKLLRLKAACSDLSAMGEDTMFMRVIPEVSCCRDYGCFLVTGGGGGGVEGSG